MPEINTEFLFTIALEIQVSSLGDTPYGSRRIFHFDGGSFEGLAVSVVCRLKAPSSDTTTPFHVIPSAGHAQLVLDVGHHRVRQAALRNSARSSTMNPRNIRPTSPIAAGEISRCKSLD
jgi:hypothetical protein